uniref:Neurotransmitter-gated ion-channel ligand-binding domain-containing protein n=1 Tax=Meloidogyne javanica TaxID=6303 RepID=A0A915MGY8_MELJA
MSYNRHRRPAIYPNEAINVYLRLRLSQIIDVHELDQIMTISVWLKQEWFDRKLSWKPSEYGGVSVLYVPYEMIWVPDIVLINFASWSFPTNLLHLTLVNESSTDVKVIGNYGQEEVETIVEDGIDLSDYYPSVEWDIMGTQAKRRLKRFMGSKNGDYEEIDFNLALRRKPLFYTVNLVFPCVALQFHFRKPTTHQMSSTVRSVFLNLLPRLLMMRRPVFMRRFPQGNRYSSASSSQLFANFERDFPQIGQRGIPLLRSTGQLGNTNKSPLATKLAKIYNSPKALQSFENLCFIAELLKKKDRDTKADMEWKFVAMDE